MEKFYCPLNFAQIAQGLYRSSYPAHRCLEFIRTLGLKSMICLYPSDIKPELREYCDLNQIILVEADVGVNQEPFLSMSQKLVSEVISFASMPVHRPCLLFCTKGTHRVNCVMGCIRKTMKWSMSSIIREYELYAGEEASMLDIQFIDIWKSEPLLKEN